jgi:hypothetical protein
MFFLIFPVEDKQASVVSTVRFPVLVVQQTVPVVAAELEAILGISMVEPLKV